MSDFERPPNPSVTDAEYPATVASETEASLGNDMSTAPPPAYETVCNPPSVTTSDSTNPATESSDPYTVASAQTDLDCSTIPIDSFVPEAWDRRTGLHGTATWTDKFFEAVRDAIEATPTPFFAGVADRYVPSEGGCMPDARAKTGNMPLVERLFCYLDVNSPIHMDKTPGLLIRVRNGIEYRTFLDPKDKDRTEGYSTPGGGDFVIIPDRGIITEIMQILGRKSSAGAWKTAGHRTLIQLHTRIQSKPVVLICVLTVTSMKSVAGFHHGVCQVIIGLKLPGSEFSNAQFCRFDLKFESKKAPTT